MVANVSYVFEQVGREIGGIAAQAVALAHFDFSGAAAIHDAMVQDAADARKRIDELNAALLNLGKTDAAVREQAAKAGSDPRGKTKISFGPESTFEGKFDLKSINADAMRELEERIETEGRLLEQSLEQWAEYQEALYEGEKAAEQRSIDASKTVAEQAQIQTDVRRQAAQMDMDLAQQALGVLGMVQNQSKGFQVGMLITQNALAAASIYANTQIAAAQALAMYGPAGPAAAAAIEAKGWVSIGLVGAATAIGIAQIQGSRRYGGEVSAGGMYDVAEPGNPELLRYGNKTLLMMGSQSGVVEPARSIAPLSTPSLQNLRVISELGFTPELVPFVRQGELQLALRYTEAQARTGAMRDRMSDLERGGPETQMRRSMEGTRRRPRRRS